MSVEGISGTESVSTAAVEQATQPEVSTEAIAPETQPLVPPAEPQNKFDEKVAAKFAALSRKEKMIKQQEQALKNREAELTARLKEKEAEAEKYRMDYENYRTGIKTSPLQKLQEEGLSFEDLTKMQLNDMNPTPEMLIKKSSSEVESKLTAKIEALEKQIAEEKEKVLQEQETRTVTTYKKQIADMVVGDTDRYELINVNYDAQSAAEEIYEIIELKYKESQGEIILSRDEAADYLENYLLNLAKKNLNAKKLAVQSAPKPQPTSEKTESVTLSNTLSAEVPKGSSKVLSRDEEIEMASKLLRWE